MTRYIYKALKETGETITGTVHSSDYQNALTNLEAQGLYPFSLEEERDRRQVKKNGQKQIFSSLFLKNKNDNLILFTRQLANLLLAGIQPGEALKKISHLLKPGKFKRIINGVYSSLKGGRDLADCLAEHPDYFSVSYISMIRAGQEGGFLGLTCQRLTQNLEDNRQLKNFIISSLIYPVILLIVAVLAIVVIFTFVLPRFMLIYANYGKSLPWPTRLLLQISSFISSYGIFLMLIICLAGLISWLYCRSESGKRKLDSLVLRLPLIGRLTKGIAITGISRSIGTMLENGVSLLKAIRVSQYMNSNLIIQEALKEAGLQVKRGGNLSDALNRSGVFPEIATYLIGVGEETGKLDSILIQVADNFERESKDTLEKAMKTFEPVMILIMGVLIGFIVIAMLLPILGINTVSF